MRFWCIRRVIIATVLWMDVICLAQSGSADRGGKGGPPLEKLTVVSLDGEIDQLEEILSQYRREMQMDVGFRQYWVRIRKLKLVDDRDYAGAGEIAVVAQFQAEFCKACVPVQRAKNVGINREGKQWEGFASTVPDDLSQETETVDVLLTAQSKTISVSSGKDGWQGEGKWSVIPPRYVSDDSLLRLKLSEVDPYSGNTWIPENEAFPEIKINFAALDFTKGTTLVKLKDDINGIEAEFEIRRVQSSLGKFLDMYDMRDKFIRTAGAKFALHYKRVLRSIKADAMTADELNADFVNGVYAVSAFLERYFSTINEEKEFGEYLRADYLRLHAAIYPVFLANAQKHPENADEYLKLLMAPLTSVGENASSHLEELLAIQKLKE